jgi:hypothetical protein
MELKRSLRYILTHYGQRAVIPSIVEVVVLSCLKDSFAIRHLKKSNEKFHVHCYR